MRPNRSRLLFIDDDREILTAYANIFKPKRPPGRLSQFVKKEESEKSVEETFWGKMNFEVDFAQDGTEGVQKIEAAANAKDAFQVAFVDMRMPPGINGVETARRIRQIDPAVEIVVITAYSDFSTGEINTVVGHPDKLIYIKKPFYNEEIKQIALNLTEKYKNERIKENFISNVSHELRTPLASISGFAKLLLDAGTLPPEQTDFARVIQDNSTLLQGLVEELITSVQMRRPEFSVNATPLNPIPVVKSVASSFVPIFGTGGEVELVAKIEEMDVKVEWDVLKIKQAITNILANAKKFTHEGRVEISCFREGRGPLGTFVVQVRDTGIGIPEDKTKAIFEEFHRLENTHHQLEGLGLGLSIAKGIVLKHGGEIEVESRPDQGSTFRLKFNQVA